MILKKKKKRNRQKVQVVVITKSGRMEDVHGKTLTWDKIIPNATFIQK